MSDKDVEDVQHNLSCELLLHSAKDLPAPRTPETCQVHPTVWTASHTYKAVIDNDNFVGRQHEASNEDRVQKDIFLAMPADL